MCFLKTQVLNKKKNKKNNTIKKITEYFTITIMMCADPISACTFAKK